MIQTSFRFCWVVDFPFFEKTDDGKWTFTHNPFSAAQPEYEKNLAEGTNIENILAAQYDIVLNGSEIGGGSIRNHNPDVLRKVFEIMGHEKKKYRRKLWSYAQSACFRYTTTRWNRIWFR